MPEGIILMRWDERTGVDVVHKHPESIEAADMTLIQVYSQHEYNQEAGTVTLTVGSTNVISYYSGPKKGYYVILLLSSDQDPEKFEDILIDGAHRILQNLKDSKFKEMTPKIFQEIVNYNSFDEEQKLLRLYDNPIKREILNRFQDEGVVDKAELKAWVFDKYRNSFIDVESILLELIKKGLIKISSVKGEGIPPILVFLINDLLIYRAPNLAVLDKENEARLPVDFIEQYKELSKSFFASYQPSEKDNQSLIKLMLDPQIHEIIQLARQKVLTRMDFEKLKHTKAEEVDSILLPLIEKEILHVFEEKGDIEYFILLTDLVVEKCIPVYHFNLIKNNYQNKVTNEKVLIEYLDLLKREYLAFISTSN